MALIFFEGFDAFSSAQVSADLNSMPGGAFLGGGTPAKNASPFGGSYFSGNSNQGFQFTPSSAGFTANYGTLIAGMRFLFLSSGAATTSNSLIRLLDAGSNQLGLYYNSSSQLVLLRGSTTVATGTTTLVVGAWYYFDLTVTFSPSVGSYTLRINGVNELTATNVNTISTANSFANSVAYYNPVSAPGGSWGMDDIYLSDNTGNAPYNAALGIVHVETLFPTANNSVQFTPLANANWQEVSEVNQDGDTTYNVAASTAIDTFTHGSLVNTPASIFAVKVDADMRKDDVVNVQGRTHIISGGSQVSGPNFTLQTLYLRDWDYYINDPNTGSTWTTSAVNNSIIGYERV